MRATLVWPVVYHLRRVVFASDSLVVVVQRVMQLNNIAVVLVVAY